MTGLLAGKTCLVTGAAGGIGRASAVVCAREGAIVAVADLDAEGGHDTVDMIRSRGGQAEFFALDVADAGQVSAVVEGLVTTYGRLDAAFNNAAYGGPIAGLLDIDEPAIHKLLSVNLLGVLMCMRVQLRQMLSQKTGGSILNASSAGGQRGMARQPIYSATKHGVIGLTRSAALEFAKSNIRINAVCPGVIDTPMVRNMINGDARVEKLYKSWMPNNRFGRPEEIGELAAWLLSDASSLVNGRRIATRPLARNEVVPTRTLQRERRIVTVQRRRDRARIPQSPSSRAASVSDG
jgi:NAD(P)-dependent dehydrogenase (short-subunit alcohol dehydrogenase family)